MNVSHNDWTERLKQATLSLCFSIETMRIQHLLQD